jgi:DNA topoisomerase-1
MACGKNIHRKWQMGPFVRFGKKMLKLGRKKDGGKFTAEEAAALPLEDVKKMVEDQVPGAFTKRRLLRKQHLKKPAQKKHHQKG